MAAYERLPAQDAAFLALEHDSVPMHVAAFATIDTSSSGGELPMAEVRRLVESRLSLLPRSRQRLIRVPVTGHLVLADDEHFDIRHHVRRIALARVGDRELFDEALWSFVSQKLDRARPLWEVLVVQGFQPDKTAAILKAHHCLMDGMSGVDLLQLLLSPEPIAEAPAPRPWRARRPPDGAALLAGEVTSRLALARQWWRAGVSALQAPQQAFDTVEKYATAMANNTRASLHLGPETPINRRNGPNRRLATLRMELDEVEELRSSLGGSTDDAVVAIATGALRRFLQGHGARVDTLDVRAIFPVSAGRAGESGSPGTKLSLSYGRLAVDEVDARKRFERTRQYMDALEEERQDLGTAILGHLSDWTSPSLLGWVMDLVVRLRAAHLMITNIRGPAEPCHVLRFQVLEIYPIPQLWQQQAFSLGVLSYRGYLHWGIVSDWDADAELDELLDCLRAETQELRKIAAEAAPEPRAEESAALPPVTGEREIATGTSERWAVALEAWDARLDLEQANRALDQFERIAAEDLGDPHSRIWCARARYYLGDYAPDSKSRQAHFEAGMILGREAVALDQDSVAARFWAGVCLASYAEGVGTLRRATLAREIYELMGAVWERDPGYYHRGVVRFLGQAFVRQPGLVRRLLGLFMPDMSTEVVMRELRDSIAEDPPFVLTHQTLAQLAHSVGQTEVVAEALRAIEALDVDNDSQLAPENRRDLPRAFELLRAL